MNGSPDTPVVAVVDDEPGVLLVCRRLLEPAGYRVEVTESPLEALELLRRFPVAVLLTDLEMPEMEGLELLREVKARADDVEVIVVTGHGTVRHAIDAMRQGALDFITKPFDPDELTLAVEKAVERFALTQEVRRLRRALGERFRLGALVARSEPMTSLFDRVQRFASADVSVLISGESGTGKEIVARAIHAESPRRDGPFVAVNCGAIVEEIFESELFGHVRGAFTGASSDKQGYFRAASGGTLFLDEVTEIPRAMQVKLLRVLQEREVVPVGSTKPEAVDLRLVAASNRHVRDAVERGDLREDLFYRINVVELEIPPLRERRADIPLLARCFVERSAERLGRPAPDLSASAMHALESHHWPGNVRELENAIEHAVVLAGTGPIRPEVLPPAVVARSAEAQPESHGFPTLSELEEAHIDRALRETDGNRARAAALLGIDPKTLYRKLARRSEAPPP